MYLPVVSLNAPCEVAIPDCFEVNNSFEEAYGPITAPGLAGTADENIDPLDYYTATLKSGTRYTFSLAVGGQDLDLYLYSAGSAHDTLASSAISGLGINEQIVFTPSTTGQYYILVYAYRSIKPAAYQLRIEQSAP